MRCSEKIFHIAYDHKMRWLFELNPVLGHKIQGIQLSSVIRHENNFSDALKTTYAIMDEQLTLLEEQGFDSKSIAVIYQFYNQHNYLGRIFNWDEDAHYCPRKVTSVVLAPYDFQGKDVDFETEKGHPFVECLLAYIGERTSAPLNESNALNVPKYPLYLWSNVSSLEWPVVIYLECNPVSLTFEEEKHIIYTRYRATSRATVKLIHITTTHSELTEQQKKARKYFQECQIKFTDPGNQEFCSLAGQGKYFLNNFYPNWMSTKNVDVSYMFPTIYPNSDDIIGKMAGTTPLYNGSYVVFNAFKHLIQDQHFGPFIVIYGLNTKIKRMHVRKVFSSLNEKQIEALEAICDNDFVVIGRSFGIILISVNNSNYSTEIRLNKVNEVLARDYKIDLIQLKSSAITDLLQEWTGVFLQTDVIMCKVLYAPNFERIKYESSKASRTNATRNKTNFERNVIYCFKEDTTNMSTVVGKPLFYSTLEMVFQKQSTKLALIPTKFLPKERMYSICAPIFTGIAAVALLSLVPEKVIKSIPISKFLESDNQKDRPLILFLASNILDKIGENKDGNETHFINLVFLTRDQQTVFNEFRRQVITGSAATGKTTILEAKAIECLSSGKSFTILAPKISMMRYKTLFDSHGYKNYRIYDCDHKIGALKGQLSKKFKKLAGIRQDSFRKSYQCIERELEEHHQELRDALKWLFTSDNIFIDNAFTAQESVSSISNEFISYGASPENLFSIFAFAKLVCPEKTIWATIDIHAGIFKNDSKYDQIEKDLVDILVNPCDPSKPNYFSITTLKQVMRCSTNNIFKRVYEDNETSLIPIELKPVQLVKNIEPTWLDEYSHFFYQTHFLFPEDALDAMWDDVSTAIGMSLNLGIDRDNIAVILNLFNCHKLLGDEYLPKELAKKYWPEKYDHKFSILHAETNLNPNDNSGFDSMVRCWFATSSKEWPVVIFASCLPKSLTPKEAKKVKFIKYRAMSRTTHQLVEITATHNGISKKQKQFEDQLPVQLQERWYNLFNQSNVKYFGPAQEEFNSFKELTVSWLKEFYPNWKNYRKPKSYFIPTLPTFVSEYRQSKNESSPNQPECVHTRIDVGERYVYDAIQQLIDNHLFAPFIAVYGCNTEKFNDLDKIFPHLKTDKSFNILQNLFQKYDFILIGPQIGIAVIAVKNSCFTHKYHFNEKIEFLPNDYNDGLAQLHSTAALTYILRICTKVSLPNKNVLKKILFTPNLDHIRYENWYESLDYRGKQYVKKKIGEAIQCFKGDATILECFKNRRKFYYTLVAILQQQQQQFQSHLQLARNFCATFRSRNFSSRYSLTRHFPSQRLLDIVLTNVNRTIYEAYAPIISGITSLTILPKTNKLSATITYNKLRFGEIEKHSFHIINEDADGLKAASMPDLGKYLLKEMDLFKVVILLNPDQQKVMNGPNRQIIFGTAGTGKTIVLQSKAIELLSKGESVSVFAPAPCMALYQLLFDSYGFKDYKIYNWNNRIASLVDEVDNQGVPRFVLELPLDTDHVIIDDAFVQNVSHDKQSRKTLGLVLGYALVFALDYPKRVVWAATDAHSSNLLYLLHLISNKFKKFFSVVVLKQVMRCTENIYQYTYHDMNLLPHLQVLPALIAERRNNQGPKYIKIIEHEKNTDFSNLLINPALNVVWVKIGDEIKRLTQNGFPLENIAVLINIHDSEVVTYLPFEISMRLWNEDQKDLYDNDCAANKYLDKASYRRRYGIGNWNSVSSLEWPVVIFASCIPKTLPIEEMRRFSFMKYIAASKATHQFIEITITHEELGIDNRIREVMMVIANSSKIDEVANSFGKNYSYIIKQRMLTGGYFKEKQVESYRTILLYQPKSNDDYLTFLANWIKQRSIPSDETRRILQHIDE